MKDNNLKTLSYLNFVEIILVLITRQIRSFQRSQTF